VTLDLTERVLYRDAMMIIIDKPSGIAVHAGSHRDDSLMLYLDQLKFGLPEIPHLAHRLDRDTSGCLVLGRHKKALARLGMLFSNGYVDKTYWAVTVGSPAQDSGLIDVPLMKLDKNRGWKMITDPKGQPSQTEWKVLGRLGRLTWIEAKPLTGRTHQIRVHLASIGCPVAGDFLYGHGVADMDYDRLHLHARTITVPLIHKAPPIVATAPIPGHMEPALKSLGA
jgi:tRNA pseudouridine32 synthase/23S rRNA pseudouridine746 synthase